MLRRPSRGRHKESNAATINRNGARTGRASRRYGDPWRAWVREADPDDPEWKSTPVLAMLRQEYEKLTVEEAEEEKKDEDLDFADLCAVPRPSREGGHRSWRCCALQEDSIVAKIIANGLRLFELGPAQVRDWIARTLLLDDGAAATPRRDAVAGARFVARVARLCERHLDEWRASSVLRDVLRARAVRGVGLGRFGATPGDGGGGSDACASGAACAVDALLADALRPPSSRIPETVLRAMDDDGLLAAPPPRARADVDGPRDVLADWARRVGA